MSKNRISRRDFLAATTTTAAFAVTGCATNTARVVPGKISPNEKLNVAAIGAGGKGQSDILGTSAENIVALCDADWREGASAHETMYRAKKGGHNPRQYTDYRKMLEEMPEIDAVNVSTPDHTHAPAAYMAMKLGKHVYVQKPLTHTVAEARLLRDTAREMKVVTQMGNQGHCGDGVRELCEMVWAGAIGDITESHTWTNRPVWPQGFTKPLKKEDIPEGLDWDVWIGTAPMRDFNGGYAPFKWRGWWDYGCGALGDMACHIMDPVYWALQLYKAKTFTVELVSQDGYFYPQSFPHKSVIKYTFPKRGKMPAVEVYWHDGVKDAPVRPEGVPADEKLGDGDNGSLFIGSKGFLTTGCYGGNSRLAPASLMKDYTKPTPYLERVPGENPHTNWTNAIKNGVQAASNFDYAAPFSEMVVFGNIVLATGRPLEYDRTKMLITNDKMANAMLSKEYRKGWELPVRKPSV